MTTINLNQHIQTFIRESNINANINGRRLTSQELVDAYNLGDRICTIVGKIRKATNIALLSYNIYLWHSSGWNTKWISLVATTGFICVKNTELYNRMTRRMLSWSSGWNTNQTIRTGLLQARNESVLEVISSATIMLGLSWRFSWITWWMCMPLTIARGLYYGVSVYGLNYILRPQFQNRVIEFLVETLSNLDSEMGGILSNSVQLPHTKSFEELVELKTYLGSDPQYCSICIQDDRTQMAKINECGHQFCQECLIGWYNKPVRVFNCPLCRINLDSPLDSTPLIRNAITQLFR